MAKASITSEERATDDQLARLMTVVSDAARKAGKIALKKADPTKEGMQRILASDELTTAIMNAIIDTTKRLVVGTNEFEKERVSSDFGYLSGYEKPKPFSKQVDRLRELFPDIDFGTYDAALASQEVDGTEGAFAIPKWQLFGKTYGEALQKVLDALKKLHNGKFVNYREGKLGPKHLRPHSRSVDRFRKLSEQQFFHNTLILHAQFGIGHRGESTRCARGSFVRPEFGLDPFTVGIMLLTHPERLHDVDDLGIDCPGGEYSPAANGAFGYAPCFYFHNGRLKFDTARIGHAYGRFGSASGRLQQYQVNGLEVIRSF